MKRFAFSSFAHAALATTVLVVSVTPIPLAPLGDRAAWASGESEPAPGRALASASVDRAPEAWWRAVGRDLSRSQYRIARAVTIDPPGSLPLHQALNRAHGLRAGFGPDGLALGPRKGEAGAWGIELSLERLEWAGGAERVPPADEALAEENRIDLCRGWVEEWYVNGAQGLEQGFNLGEPPGGAAARDTLRLVLALKGSARARLDDAGVAVEISTPEGEPVLRYGEPTASDAEGRGLPARLEIAGCGEGKTGPCELAIVVDPGPRPAFPITIDPLIQAPAWSKDGDQVDAHWGWSVASAGDVNHDGYDDVIVGVPDMDSGGLADRGFAVLYLGTQWGLSTVTTWQILGSAAGDRFGYSVASAGDVDCDGYDDVIVGAPEASHGESGEGEAYVYLGQDSGLMDVAHWVEESDEPGARFGWSVAGAGNVNAGGCDDVIVGAPYFGNGQVSEGAAFVYNGSSSVGLSHTPSWSKESNKTGARFGARVAGAGDVDGDGDDEVIVGAPDYSNPEASEGMAFVYYGSAAGLSIAPSWDGESDQAGAEYGGSVASAGDVNADGYDDVLVAAAKYDRGSGEEGRVWIYCGSAAPGGLGTVQCGQRTYLHLGALYGFSVASAGDVDGNGSGDVIIGAPWTSNGQTHEGYAEVFHGHPARPPLTGYKGWSKESNKTEAAFGQSVASAGDVDGDGYDEVIVGAPYYEAGQAGEGMAFLYMGSPDLTGLADYTKDRRDEIGVFRNGMWFLSYSPDLSGVDLTRAFGSATAGADRPEVGEFGCITAGGGKSDGRTDLAILRKATSTWQATLSPDWGASPDVSVTFGTTAHKRIATRFLDVNADGCSDIGVFRNGCFDILYSPKYASVGKHVCFGLSTDEPLAMDMNRDGASELILWRAGSSHYTYRLSTDDYTIDKTTDMGAGEIPLVGDVDGDSLVDLGSYRASTSTFRFSYSSWDPPEVNVTVTHGMNGDIPILADVNGDGSADIGVFRNAVARWLFLCSPTWTTTCVTQSFGVAGDIPVFGKPPGMP